MKKYQVEITYSSTAIYEVEAKNEDDAKQMALDGEGYIKTYDSEYNNEVDVSEGWGL
tara:strand:- start:907 stop:1077 length:171 start_codon:yes stop_codon:yes gene_type:complete